MKCEKPNTDQVCEVCISTGDKTYAEYVLDPSISGRAPKPNVFESFIPVHEAEQITVNVRFSGTVLHGAADVIADGAFVFDRRIEGDRKGKVKHQSRKWKGDLVLNVPHGRLDTEVMHSGTAVVEGNLYVKALHPDDKPLFNRAGGKLGLGSIAVIISVNQDNKDNYAQRYNSQTVGRWRDRPVESQADGGIVPTHELEFRMEDDEVHFNRQQRHKRHGEQTRFGLKPWGVFVFFYRAQGDIQQAGCVLRPNKVVQVERHHGDFTFADPNAIMKKRLATRAKNEREKREAKEIAEDEEEEDGEGDPSDFNNDGHQTRSITRSPSDGQGLFISRERGQIEGQKKRLGGNLGMQSAGTDANRRDSHFSHNGAMIPQQQHLQPKGDWQDLFGDELDGDNITEAQPRYDNRAPAEPQHSISGTNQGADFDFDFGANLQAQDVIGEIDHGMQLGGFDAAQAPATAPVAKMYSSSPSQDHQASMEQQEAGDVVQSTEMPYRAQYQPQFQYTQQQEAHYEEEEEAEPSPLAQMISGAVEKQFDESKAAKQARLEAKHAKKVRPPPQPKGKAVFDPTAKTGYGFGNPKMTPGQSMAPGSYAPPTRAAMQQLDANDKNIQGMLQNFLSDPSGMQQQQYGSTPKSSPQSVPYERPWEATQPAKSAQPTRSVQHAMSPPVRVAQPNLATNSLPPPSPQPAQAWPYTSAPMPKMASAVPRKRSASIISHDSTSSKRSSADDRANRKAALLVAMQEKQKAKDAEAKRLEDGRRAREEMDRRREEAERQEREAAEAEEAELAALEAQLAGADAEIEAMQEQGRREAEEARMRELEREREGEE